MTNDDGWFSTSKIVPSGLDNDYDYCSFCLTSFHKYNPTINNICQVCGRVNQKVLQDKQEQQQLTAVNTHVTDPTQSTMRAVSMEIKYTNLLSQDETKKGLYSGNTYASFNSFKEAQEYLNKISDLNNTTLNARAKQRQKYYTTTSKTHKTSILNSLSINEDNNNLSSYETTNNEEDNDNDDDPYI